MEQLSASTMVKFLVYAGWLVSPFDILIITKTMFD